MASEDQSTLGLEIDPEDLQPRPWVLPGRRRVLTVAGIVLVLLLLVFLPPLISFNHFRRQIVHSVSASLGRPVHIDAVTLNLLPMPGFTLQNFVVTEDPAFGSEPVIRANSVKVTLRVMSLWRRKVEFSRISLEDPSVNLVHGADGRWNIESILLHASEIEAAPTAQTKAGDAPRFPYIEATGARVNMKAGLEKLPISLTDAEFALWLPEPNEWRLRLLGHPARTNAAPNDTGTIRIQGTLGKAATMQDVPVDLTAEWRTAPLGGVSSIVLGRDAGVRGEMNLTTTVQGTVGRNKVRTRLELSDLRRAQFVPQQTLDADITCTADATANFHQFSAVQCGWPSEMLTNPAAHGVKVVAAVPDVTQWRDASGDATLNDVPVSGLLTLLRLASPRVAPNVGVSGSVEGKLACCATAAVRGKKPAADSNVSGQLTVKKAELTVDEGKAIVESDVEAAVAGEQVTLRPVALELGGPQAALLEVRVDRGGLVLHLTGAAIRSRLLQLAKALPEFGDGIEQVLPAAVEGAVELPIRVDLVANRGWKSGAVWSSEAARPAKRKSAAR